MAGLCLFHDPSERKSAKDFQERFLKELEANPRRLDCRGFVFPPFELPHRFEVKTDLMLHECVFLGRLFLFEVTFHSQPNFYKSRFRGPVSFYGSLFHDGVGLQRTVFEDVVDLSSAIFEGYSDFHGTTFRSDLYCLSTTFRAAPGHASRVSFREASFHGVAIFRYAKFLVPAAFSECRFLGRAEFIDLTLEGPFKAPGLRRTKDEWEPAIDFANTFVAQEGGVRFVGLLGDVSAPAGPGRRPMSLWAVKFALATVHRMDFVNVAWTPPEGQSLPEGWNRAGLVFDEQLLTSDAEVEPSFHEALSYEHVAAIYKGLRVTFETSLRFAEAGQFHVREMEMRRLAAGTPSLLKARRTQKATTRGFWRFMAKARRQASMLNAYRLTSNYGESYIRAFWSIVLWFLAVAAFERWLRPRWLPEPLGWPHELVNQAIALMPAQVAGDSVTDFVGRLVGVFLIAGFVIALRRHFRR